MKPPYQRVRVAPEPRFVSGVQVIVQPYTGLPEFQGRISARYTNSGQLACRDGLGHYHVEIGDTVVLVHESEIIRAVL